MDQFADRRLQLRQIFAALISAYGRKDFDVFAAHIEEQAVFDWPFLPLKTFPDTLKGRDAFIEISKVGMADCDGYNHQVDAYHDQLDPDCLIVEYHSDTTMHSTGHRYENKYLGILRFSGPKVVYWREYVNPLPIIEGYGLDYANAAITS